MSRIKKYEDFLNEGKITQFVLKTLLNTSGYIQSIIKRIKGTYIPFTFKDKKVENDFENKKKSRSKRDFLTMHYFL